MPDRTALLALCRRAHATRPGDEVEHIARLWRLHLRALQWDLVRLRQARWREAIDLASGTSEPHRPGGVDSAPRRATAGLITLDRSLEAPAPDKGLAPQGRGLSYGPVRHRGGQRSGNAGNAMFMLTVDLDDNVPLSGPPAPPPPLVIDVIPEGLTILDVGRGQCRWPVGEVEGRHLFCGEPVIERRRYCRDHHARSLRKV
jgi:GcrA cell cycle regulator